MPKATIILLLKNAEQYLGETLCVIQDQKIGFDFEVLAIDSGSKDRTLEILKAYPQVRLITIPPESFNHGETRNLGVREAHPDSEYVVFLTQDATPANETWLEALLTPFAEDPQTAGVFSRHIPRPGASPSLVRQLTTVWQTGGQQRLVKKMPPSLEEFKRNRFFYNYFSNTSSALRRDVWKQIPFRPVQFAEDAVWADEVIQGGFTIVFEPRSCVLHSHSYNFVEQFRQNVDYTNAIKDLFNPAEYNQWLTWLRLFRGIPRNVWRDWIFVNNSPYFSGTPLPARLGWSFHSLGWHLASALGGVLGAHLEGIHPAIKKYISRQERIKRKK